MGSRGWCPPPPPLTLASHVASPTKLQLFSRGLPFFISTKEVLFLEGLSKLKKKFFLVVVVVVMGRGGGGGGGVLGIKALGATFLNSCHDVKVGGKFLMSE